MANELTIQKTGQLPAASAEKIARAKKRAQEITAGISLPFARITYKQGKWGLRQQGVTTPLYRMEEQPDKTFIKRVEEDLDIILLDVAERTSKVFYEKGYDGSANAPDCGSSDGIRPDAGMPKPQSPTCAACKWNRWGSRRATEDRPASRGKECADHKKAAVVPVHDIENKSAGGPIMLTIPPSSLKSYKLYVDKLAEVGFEPDEVWTRINFKEDSDYPLFVFDAPGVLSAEQRALSQKVKAEHQSLVERILSSPLEAAEGWDEPEGKPETAAQPADEPEVTGDGKPNGHAVEEPVIEVPAEAGQVEEPDEYTYSPDKTLRWKAGMANWEPVPPPPLPPTPPPLPQGPPPLPTKPAVKKAATRTKPPSPEPHDSAAASGAARSAGVPPTPTNPAPLTGNGKGADPDVTAKIAAMVDKLV